jgi:hypothetical protein
MKGCFGGIIFQDNYFSKFRICAMDLSVGRIWPAVDGALGRDGKGEAARPEYLEYNRETGTTNFLI